MPPHQDVPNAHSEPQDDEDAVMSAIMHQAAEMAHFRDGKDCSSPIPALIDQLLRAVESSPELKYLADTLPLTLGSGALLQSIFMRVFEAKPRAMAHARTPDIDPILTAREREIIMEMAKGHNKKEIAAKLCISANTAKSHFNSIYAKLQASNPASVVARAVALGQVSLDVVDAVLPNLGGEALSLYRMPCMLVGARQYGAEGVAEDGVRPGAALGLLIFTLSSWLNHSPHFSGSARQFAGRRGCIYELDKHGNTIMSFDAGETLRIPLGIAVAPETACSHGFTPGNLFILNGFSFVDGLNSHSIVECSPEGEMVRHFTGGRHVSTRLNGESIAFSSDGRLMVGSGGYTDAILEFTDGGRSVRRFADIIPYGGIAAGPNGTVYCVGGGWYQAAVHVYGRDGMHTGKIGFGEWVPGAICPYEGVAVDGCGTVYVANNSTSVVEVYSADGKRHGTVAEAAMTMPWQPSLGSGGLLYVLEGCIVTVVHSPTDAARCVKLFDRISGAYLGSIAGPNGVGLSCIAVGSTGNLLIGGFHLS